jgi:hypothetical protein
MNFVRPSTLVEWFRRFASKKYDGSAQRRTPGRPRKAEEVRKALLQLASENLTPMVLG